MLENLKLYVLKANLELPKLGLVEFTWGNVSAIDREKGIIAIKPSGVDYERITVDDIVLVNLNGELVEGKRNPSSDTPTHVELYKAFPDIAGVVHTHSMYAVSFAQAMCDIPAYGTTHADHFYGDIPCTRLLSEEEVLNDYEKNTGIVIADTFKDKDYNAIPGVIVANHGPFTWGTSALDAVHNSAVLEIVAKMAILTKSINSDTSSINKYILDKHYLRKHGDNAYYGQKK